MTPPEGAPQVQTMQILEQVAEGLSPLAKQELAGPSIVGRTASAPASLTEGVASRRTAATPSASKRKADKDYGSMATPSAKKAKENVAAAEAAAEAGAIAGVPVSDGAARAEPPAPRSSSRLATKTPAAKSLAQKIAASLLAPIDADEAGPSYLGLDALPFSGYAPPARLLANGMKPTTMEEAGADIPSLIAMAAACNSLEAIQDGIDRRLPAYKGNNIHAKLLRQAFNALRLGAFNLRKNAVSLMAQKLWLLAGKEGESVAQTAAASIAVEHLPEELKQYGATGDALANPPDNTCLSQYFNIRGPRQGSAISRPPVNLNDYNQTLVRWAAIGRHQLGISPGLPAVLRTQLLAGQRVKYVSPDGEVVLQGELTPTGHAILCGCSECAGAREVSPEEFERHAGSNQGRFLAGIVFEGKHRAWSA